MKIINPFSKPHILILTPLILVMVLDLVFTMVGQPEIYWAGSYQFFNEGGFVGAVLLGYHPGAFVLFFIVYLLFVLFLATNLKRPLNIMVAIGFFLGHAWGSASWIPRLVLRFSPLGNRLDFNDWYAITAYFIVIAVISGICANQWLKMKNV